MLRCSCRRATNDSNDDAIVSDSDVCVRSRIPFLSAPPCSSVYSSAYRRRGCLMRRRAESPDVGPHARAAVAGGRVMTEYGIPISNLRWTSKGLMYVLMLDDSVTCNHASLQCIHSSL